jgi:cell division protein FtsW
VTRQVRTNPFAPNPLARWGLLSAVAVLSFIGALMAFSVSGTSKATTSGLNFTNGFKMLVFIAVGALAAFIISRINYRKLEPWAVITALICVAALVAVFFFKDANGAHRWIDLKVITIQPSEFAKPILVTLLACACARLRDRVSNNTQRRNVRRRLLNRDMLKGNWPHIALIAASLILIICEPDFGTVLILAVTLFVAYILCDWPVIVPAILAGCAVPILALRVFVFSDKTNYIRTRVLEFFSAKTGGGATPDQNLQAEYAFGSGGILGQGPGLSRQKYTWLYAADDDFVLAVVGEELGLVGTFLVLAGFATILLAGIRIALSARDRLGRALAGASTICLVFQAVLNIFVATGMMPVSGKPLPFVTMGGSSTIASFMLVGLIMSVARFGHLAPDGIGRSTGRTADDESDRPGRGNSNRGGKSGRKSGSDGTRRKRGGSGRGRGTGSGRRGRARDTDEGEVTDDADDFEWRWDSRAYLPGACRG